MEDREIVELYWARKEQAITETDQKYGAYCRTIARNILHSRQDAEECVSDTWLKAWNAMPPKRPSILSVFLGTITRNLSLDRYRAEQSQKRGGGQVPLVWEELEHCVSGRMDLETSFSMGELSALLDGFLRSLPDRDRCIFIRRYWYTDSILDIARRCRMSEGAVKVKLHRIRKKLRTRLEQEGYTP